jgi:sulfur-carrier protein
VSVTLVLPGHLRDLAAGGAVEIAGSPGTVRDVLDALRLQCPPAYERIVTERRELRPHVNVFVDREDIRWSGALDTPVPDGAEVIVLPSVSGG